MQQSFYEQGQPRSSFVDHYWHMIDVKNGDYPLYMTVKWGFVFSKFGNTYRIQLVGPRTTPTTAHFRDGEYFWSIVMNADVNLTGYAKKDLLNKVIELKTTDGQSFVLADKTLQIPQYSELDTFVERLIQENILYITPIAAASQRDQQRKAKRFTGLTPKQIEQAARVERAIILMDGSYSLSWVATEAGFADQAHMNRDFRRLVGYSPAEIRAMLDAL
ncbi:MAG TPA: helix-turn-helix domain-containing protein [Candidatus Saccharimonadales bacterium]|nr:helix-turn-helix domain-containing protein [Candidatus Saccharimonadales bacterium]